MRIRCAIIDFDGTLFDSMFIWDTAGEIYLRSLGKEPEAGLRKDLKTLSLYQSACYFRKKYGLTLSEDEIMAGINKTVESFYINDVLPKPGAVAFLDKMKDMGITLCIATATDRKQIEAALQRCKIKEYFKEIFTCGEVGHGKDEPVIFRKAMEYCGAERETTVVFEDALHAARVAKNDGFKVVAVYDESEDQKEELFKLSDCYIDDFEHTQALLRFLSYDI